MIKEVFFSLSNIFNEIYFNGYFYTYDDDFSNPERLLLLKVQVIIRTRLTFWSGRRLSFKKLIADYNIIAIASARYDCIGYLPSGWKYVFQVYEIIMAIILAGATCYRTINFIREQLLGTWGC